MISEKYGIVPISQRAITCPYSSTHNGIDIGYKIGTNPRTEIWAWKSGVVVANGNESLTGNFIDLEHYNEDGTKQVSHYNHLDSLSPLKVGTKVKQGDVIGIRGNTGKSTGYHLHFAISQKYSGNYEKNFVRNHHINPLNEIYWAKDKQYDWNMDYAESQLIKDMPSDDDKDYKKLYEQAQAKLEKIRVDGGWK